MKKYLVSAVSCALLCSAVSSHATPPFKPDLVAEGNRWTITFYDDGSGTHNQWATQGLCFYYAGTYGSQQRYQWVSDTFPDWNGLATQEGDQIFMHGDYAQDVGHDGMEWEIVTRSRNNMGAGHWKEWREDSRFGRTIGWGNARFERVGRCEPDSAEEAWEKYRDIGYPRDDKGREMYQPMGNQSDNQ
ncbi:hypothetical protein GCM10009092_11990 [Bowmanella denitrificans]|uniref:Uncharacterized protein n=1 Tax=Bowmanella denitrificans TaxID=366582 RepID=A0ABN0WX79_9ALTE